jgi:hypothetical protein
LTASATDPGEAGPRHLDRPRISETRIVLESLDDMREKMGRRQTLAATGSLVATLSPRAMFAYSVR